MATGKGVGGGKSKGGMDWSTGVRPSVVQRSDDSPASQSHVQNYLSAIVVVMCAVLVLLLPVLGIMFGDLNHAVEEAKAETERMKKLRNYFVEEWVNERDAKRKRLGEHPVQETDGNELRSN